VFQPQKEPTDSVIEKAREAASSYTSGLPNFFARQTTARYASERAQKGWQALDIVTADLAYEDGNETYKNIRVGNKPVNQKMQDIEGTRSTGEFATILDLLFDPASAATFRKSGSDTIRNRAAWLYRWEVTRERARWRVIVPSQLYIPALRGSVWIDKETSRVLRIEQQGRSLPVLFPFDTVEAAVDYDFIRLSGTGPYLLPVEAEVLSCVRSTSQCYKNHIEFRNYRKFGAETDITFDDPH